MHRRIPLLALLAGCPSPPEVDLPTPPPPAGTDAADREPEKRKAAPPGEEKVTGLWGTRKQAAEAKGPSRLFDGLGTTETDTDGLRSGGSRTEEGIGDLTVARRAPGPCA